MNYSGEELRKLRLRLAITQEALGFILGTSTETITRYEHRENLLSGVNRLEPIRFELMGVLSQIVEKKLYPFNFHKYLKTWRQQGRAYVLFRILQLVYGTETKKERHEEHTL